MLRAKNAIYIDSTFAYLQKGSGAGGNTLLFAEQGNVEAIVNPEHSTVAFTVDGGNDTAELRIQAGNRVWEEGTIYVPTIENGARQSANAPGAEFNGNILLDKPLEINHSGLGRTLLSASRDIESQVHAPMWFVYKNKNLTDSVIVTAGRHIETHAKMRFDFTDAAENR